MGHDGGSLQELYRLTRAEQDEALRRVDLKPGRARLVREVLAPRSRSAPARPRRVWTAGAAGVVALATAAALLFFLLRPRALAFQAGGEATGVPGAWIEGGRAVTFSDGTRLDLTREARARIASIDARGAAVVLESGRASASVVHREGTRWSVLAGPFEVRVTGTRFDVAWDPATEAFELTLREGSVVTTGPLLGDGRAVQRGETLRVSVKAQRLELTRDDAEPPPAPASLLPAPTSDAGAEPAAPVAVPGPGPSPSPSVAVPGPSPSPPLRPAWLELAAHGKYKDAMTSVDREGFDAVLGRSSARDLATLGDAARLSGDSARATRALQTLRGRFPGTDESAASAFLLGRMAFEGGNAPEAERWLGTYLAEQPSGPFAREAEGRLLECRERRGDTAGAREAARRYLERYPTGPHAAKAQSLLDN